jgi:hypothetical protein
VWMIRWQPKSRKSYGNQSCKLLWAAKLAHKSGNEVKSLFSHKVSA